MSGHFEEGHLQAWLDNEIEGEAAEEIARHLEACKDCRNRVEELRRLEARVSDLLTPLDPPVDLDAARWRLRKRLSHRKTFARRHWNAAAALLLFFMTAAAAAALPGSPIRTWISSLGGTEQENLPLPLSEEVEPLSGIAVEPVEGQVEVVLQGLPAGGEVTLRREGNNALELQTAGTARYTTAPGRIEAEIQERSPTSILIRIPTSAQEFHLVLGDQTLLRWVEGTFLPGEGIQNEEGAEEGTFLLRIPPDPSTTEEDAR